MHWLPTWEYTFGLREYSEREIGLTRATYDAALAELDDLTGALLDECYHAVAGGGALRNGRPIRVSPETSFDRALLATGFAYDKRENDDNLSEFRAVLKTARELRRDGSASLDLCYDACGRLEGYWEHKLKPWDVAAGGLIVREAGGRVTDRDGGPAWRSGAEIVATNGALHEELLRVPLVVRAPGRFSPGRELRPVATLAA